MYKVLLIDDEEMALEYLRDLTDWEEQGFYIAGAAVSAEEALKIFQEELPEAVISDICMPEQSGLEFCEHILRLNPITKIILLSAYQEFEYARKALNLGAVDYILKYELTKELLDEKLKMLSDLLNEEMEKRSRYQRQGIRALLNGEETFGKDRVQAADVLDPDILSMELIVLRMDDEYFESDSAWKKAERTSSFSETDMIRLIDTETGPDQGRACIRQAVSVEKREFAVIYGFKCRAEEVEPYADDIAKRTVGALSREDAAGWSAAYAVTDLSRGAAADQYKKICSFMDWNYFRQKEYVVCITEDALRKMTERKESGDEERILEQIDSRIVRGEFSGAADAMRQLFRKYVLRSGTFSHWMELCSRMLRKRKEWAERYFVAAEDETMPEWMKIPPARSFPEIGSAYAGFIEKMAEHLNDKEYARYSWQIRAAIDHLNEYYKKDISVNDVAESIGLSASYLSRRFKSETGKTVLEYLTDVRIGQACRMLEEDRYKVYEIGEKVGYKTSQYFSEVFTREIGMSPGAYRKKARERYEEQH